MGLESLESAAGHGGLICYVSRGHLISLSSLSPWCKALWMRVILATATSLTIRGNITVIRSRKIGGRRIRERKSSQN